MCIYKHTQRHTGTQGDDLSMTRISCLLVHKFLRKRHQVKAENCAWLNQVT